MSSQDAINKIKKLLNVTAENGATEGEIENAMRMARRLMNEHNLTEAELIRTTEVLIEDFVLDDTSSSFAPWERRLARVCAEANDCELYFAAKFRGAQIRYVGRPTDTAMGAALYTLLHAALLHRSRRQYETSEDRRSYREGFCSGLYSKLKEEMRSASAKAGELVSLKNAIVKDWMTSNLSLRLRSSPARPVNDAYVDGFENGKKTSLNKKVIQ